MSPHLCLRLIIEPTLQLLGEMGLPPDDRARVMLLAIAGQESGFMARRQMYRGPARGLWQFERDGGTAGVLRHKASRPYALLLCPMLLFAPDPATCWEAVENNDTLACAFARLLLLTDAKPLPTGHVAGWEYYLRNWRPGKPHPETWNRHWTAAMEAVHGKPG